MVKICYSFKYYGARPSNRFDSNAISDEICELPSETYQRHGESKVPAQPGIPDESIRCKETAAEKKNRNDVSQGGSDSVTESCDLAALNTDNRFQNS